MKKVYISLFLLALSLVLVACGGDGSRGDTSTGKLVEWYELSPEARLDTSKEVTIKFWHRMGGSSRALIVKWIAEFKEMYPNITVIEEKAADDYNALADNIALSFPAGTTPDISESYPDHIARYATAKKPLALNNFISHPEYGYKQEEIADFLPSLWAEGTSYDNEGTFLSLPFSKSSEAFFYNKTYFEANNYAVPTTWDELFAIAAQIKAKEAGAFPFGYDSSDNLFITASKQYGAPYTGYNAETGKGEILFNNDKSKEMVTYFKDKIDKGLMLTRDLNGGSYTSDIFKTGEKLYMYVGSTGGTRYALNQTLMDKNIKVGVAPLPAFSADAKAQVQQGPNINLFNNNDEQRMIAAWLFSKYMMSPEKSAEFSIPSGYAPARYSTYETDTWKTYLASIDQNPTTLEKAQDKLVKEAIDIFLNNGDIFFTQAVFNQSSKMRGEAGVLITKIFSYAAKNPEDLQNYIDQTYQDSYDFVTN